MSEDTMETEETEWTMADLQKLLAAMKDSIPKNKKAYSYIRGLKSLDWNKVAFPPFSPEACKQKWTKILEKMRKIRTLTELIVEAEDFIAKPVCNRKLKQGEECPEDEEGLPPRPPHTGYNMFCKEQLTSMTGISRKNKLDVCGQRWQKLSETEKEKYRIDCAELKRRYRIKLKEYLERFDKEEWEQMCTENGIKRSTKRKLKQGEECPEDEDEEGLPPRPPRSGYNIFCKEQLACMSATSKRNKFDVCSQRWQKLSETEKKKYRTDCAELKRQYRIKLKEYLERFDKEEWEQMCTENGIKRSKKRKLVEQLPGEPKRPSLSGNVIFCQNQMELLKEKIPNGQERFVKANRMWQNLSTKEKKHYNEKVVEKMEKYSMELQMWFKTLTAAEQKNYLTSNPTKHQYLKAKEKDDFVKEPSLCQPSDSEDDNIDFSEEESCWVDDEEEEEEEEEEDEEDAMFEM